MFRHGLAILGCLAFCLAPTFCVAGILRHACDCSPGVSECDTCCVGELGCSCVEKGCSHDGCANDPCQVAVAPQTLSGRALGFALLVALPAVDSLGSARARPPHRPAASSAPRGARRNIPLPLSDIPLLI